MKKTASGVELYHDIFGSILDRTEMTPYLLLPATDYDTALAQATKMMGNRGFDVRPDDAMADTEKRRALNYVRQVYRYFFEWMFPFVKAQLTDLAALGSLNQRIYHDCRQAVRDIEATLTNRKFRELIMRDPRHLFLLASSRKYPHVFHGYGGRTMDVHQAWQKAACAVLKLASLVKSIEEDSQDINDHVQLGIFLQSQGQSLNDLYSYDWDQAPRLPRQEPAQRAFVKIAAFFHKLRQSVQFDRKKGCLVFDSGDGVRVDIVEIKARLKSPESMFTKLGKDEEGESYNIRDILAVTFILRNRDDTLTLFHALQKRGVILQENTLSRSITQTLFDDHGGMTEATRRLMVSLAQSGGEDTLPSAEEVLSNSAAFYKALSVNAAKNAYSSVGHRKFQCKIAFSVPVHRSAKTNRILIPGTSAYRNRDRVMKRTQQHTLGVELRISDEESWLLSEKKGDSHHDAYKFRQLVSVMNRVFRGWFRFPESCKAQLRRDQAKLFR